MAEQQAQALTDDEVQQLIEIAAQAHAQEEYDYLSSEDIARLVEWANEARQKGGASAVTLDAVLSGKIGPLVTKENVIFTKSPRKAKGVAKFWQKARGRP